MGVEKILPWEQYFCDHIATGFNSEQQHEIVNTEAKKIIHTLEEEQPLVHDLTETKAPQNIFDDPIEEISSNEPIVKYSLEEEVEESPVFEQPRRNQ